MDSGFFFFLFLFFFCFLASPQQAEKWEQRQGSPRMQPCSTRKQTCTRAAETRFFLALGGGGIQGNPGSRLRVSPPEPCPPGVGVL